MPDFDDGAHAQFQRFESAGLTGTPALSLREQLEAAVLYHDTHLEPMWMAYGRLLEAVRVALLATS